MKLPDFSSDTYLDQVRMLMGAKPVETDIRPDWTGISTDELRQIESSYGLEIGTDLSVLERADDGTFVYKGRRVLLYIRDQWFWPSQPNREYKFHIGWCKTIEDMFASGRKNRYVITNNTSSSFQIVETNRNTGEVRFEGEREMHVCKNCLDFLDYHGYSMAYRTDRKEIYRAFSLDEFFGEYGRTHFRELPEYTAENAPRNEYTSDFAGLSRGYRQKIDWKCEGCGLNLSSHPEWLHVHHINGIRSDNRSTNLRALCIRCHSKEPGHDGLRTLPQFELFEGEYPPRTRPDGPPPPRSPVPA